MVSYYVWLGCVVYEHYFPWILQLRLWPSQYAFLVRWLATEFRCIILARPNYALTKRIHLPLIPTYVIAPQITPKRLRTLGLARSIIGWHDCVDEVIHWCFAGYFIHDFFYLLSPQSHFLMPIWFFQKPIFVENILRQIRKNLINSSSSDSTTWQNWCVKRTISSWSVSM